MKKHTGDAVVANQILHSTLAPTYETDEPHFRPENRAKVKARLAEISDQLSPCLTMVDLGCGTGFLEELAPEKLTRIIGIDSTDAMLELLRKKALPRVHLLNEQVENTSLPDSISDLVTGYSVLDHFQNTNLVFLEAARLLRSGGILYMDLIPNSDFWKNLRLVKSDHEALNSIVKRELAEVINHSSKMFDQHGISPDVLSAAEPHKETRDGFLIEELEADLLKAGFTNIDIRREWFLGEATVLHGTGQSEASVIASHLKRLSPLTDHLFKYLWFTAVKI